MARTRVPRSKTRAVTPRTAARRARRVAAQAAAAKTGDSRRNEPETLGQARVWERKRKRYQLAGLCYPCSATAAWGHAAGFQRIPDPCSQCLPLVAKFPNDGPRGSKWRKILTKLEYLTADELEEWRLEHKPDDPSFTYPCQLTIPCSDCHSRCSLYLLSQRMRTRK